MKELKKYRVAAGKRFHWDDIDPDDRARSRARKRRCARPRSTSGMLDPLQERLYAEGKRSLL